MSKWRTWRYWQPIKYTKTAEYHELDVHWLPLLLCIAVANAIVLVLL